MPRSKIKFGGRNTPEEWVRAIDNYTREGINQLGEKIYKKLVEEAPSNKYESSGHTPLKKSIVYTRAVRIRPGVYRLTYTFPPYVRTLVEGVTYGQGIYHTPGSRQAMSFSQRAFPNGDKSKSYYKNGRYFFKRVRYHVRKNDFINRAFGKIERTTAYRELGDYIQKAIKYA